MKKVIMLLLYLVCITSVTAKPSTPNGLDTPRQYDALEDMSSDISELSIAQVVGQIRWECTQLATAEKIEAKYLSSFIEICVIDNIAMTLEIGQDEERVTEYPVEAYIGVALQYM